MGVPAAQVLLAVGLAMAQDAPQPPQPSHRSPPLQPLPPPTAVTGAAASPASPASAGEARGAAVVAPPRVAAQAMLAEGNQRLKEGDAAAAIVHYRRAQKVYPPAAPKIEFNIAKAEQIRGDQPAAAAAFERFLARALDTSPEFREEALQELRKLTAVLGVLKLAAPRAGLLVAIDGEEQGMTPLPGNLWVRPGARVVTVKDGDTVAFRQIIEVSGGATVEVQVTVRAAPPPTTASSGARTVAPPLGLVLNASPPPAGSALAVDIASERGDQPGAGPLWRKWWFWAGGGGLIAATLVTVLLVGDGCPDGAECMAGVLPPANLVSR